VLQVGVFLDRSVPSVRHTPLIDTELNRR
jgi:hypothetical protein